MSFQLKEATISSIHQAMQNGELTCRQLVEAYLERINKYDKQGPCINAIITINPRVLEEADEKDRLFKEQGFTGPLHGIPVVIKDNIQTNDLPTTGAFKGLDGYVPKDDAFLTKKLREAGAVIIAKTNLSEFAFSGETVGSLIGQTKNPYDLTRTPGGSSGGTGASMACNFATIGIGTDTVNSVRSPSSACSICGIRPTMGLVSRSGLIPYSLTHDTAGPLCRTVEDAAKTLAAISGYDPDDIATAACIGNYRTSYEDCFNVEGLKGKTIGVLEAFLGQEECHKDVNNAFENAVKKLEEAGAKIVRLNDEMDLDWLIFEVGVQDFEMKSHLGGYLKDADPAMPITSLEDIHDGGLCLASSVKKIEGSIKRDVTDPDYAPRRLLQTQLKERVLKMMADNELDAITYPHQSQLVCKIGLTQQQRNGALGMNTGFPSIVVPAGFSAPSEEAPIGVPVGIEFLGRPWKEAEIIEIAYAFEQASKERKLPVSTEE